MIDDFIADAVRRMDKSVETTQHEFNGVRTGRASSALLDPSLILALGGTAAEWFVGPSARIASLRGQSLSYDGRPLRVTYHPSAAIRFGPAGAPLAALREDLGEVAREIARPPAGA